MREHNEREVQSLGMHLTNCWVAVFSTSYDELVSDDVKGGKTHLGMLKCRPPFDSLR